MAEMRIAHLSDTHGAIPEIPDGVDVVVHSGDILPSFSRGVREIEVVRQSEWLDKYADVMAERWCKVPLVFVQGNHDYVSPLAWLRKRGATVHDISDGAAPFQGVHFAGYCRVPWFTGEWNHERSEAEIRHDLGPMAHAIRSKDPVVLVFHAPIEGVLDRNHWGQSCGSRAIRDVLELRERKPKAYLHGHIHAAYGLTEWQGITVSNAAAGPVRVVEI